MGSGNQVPSGWKPVVPPPPGYERAIRRVFLSGLQVMILVRKTGAGYDVVSCADHGTRKCTVRTEGQAVSGSSLEPLIRGTSATWREPVLIGATVPAPDPKVYRYTSRKGAIAGPVGREELFELVASGAIGWESEIWEDARAPGQVSRWKSVSLVLGVPQDPEVYEYANE